MRRRQIEPLLSPIDFINMKCIYISTSKWSKFEYKYSQLYHWKDTNSHNIADLTITAQNLCNIVIWRKRLTGDAEHGLKIPLLTLQLFKHYFSLSQVVLEKKKTFIIIINERIFRETASNKARIQINFENLQISNK